MTTLHSLTPRLLAGFGTLALIGAIGLVSSRPAHTAGGPIAVSVANTPLLTKATDVAAPQQPFTANTTYVFQNGNSEGTVDTADGYADIAVPAGKRLVIQTVSLNHFQLHNETLQAYISPLTNGIQGSYALPLASGFAPEHPGVTQTLTVYADPGTTVPFEVFRSQLSDPEPVFLTVSGYLVNA